MMLRAIFASLLLLSTQAQAALPPATTHEPQARVQVAPYRYDDVLWENDRTAHRIYGHALEGFEPPSGSGIDAWGKFVRWPFMDRQLRSGDQHAEHGEGLDFYDVRTARGAGGLGIWYDNKLWTSRNYRTVRILNPGPKVASFEVNYAPWPVDVVRTVSETRRFTLPLGTNFTRMVSTLRSSKGGPLMVGIGIGKRTTAVGKEEMVKDIARGFVSVWSAPAAGKGSIAVAILFDPRSFVRMAEDADNYLIILREQPGVPFVYYTGAAWDGGLDFRDHDAWTAYLRAQRPDFDPRH